MILGKAIHAVPIEQMQQIYDEVKTPFKYGVVIRGEEKQLVDSPSVFCKDLRDESKQGNTCTFCAP